MVPEKGKNDTKKQMKNIVVLNDEMQSHTKTKKSQINN